MLTYGNRRPAQDAAEAALPDRRDWLVVPAALNRDSTPTQRSNFETAMKMLGGEGEDVERRRVAHWATEWIEVALVRPGSRAAEVAGEIEGRLASRPALDERDAEARELEDYRAAWEAWGAAEFVGGLAERLGLDDSTREALLEADKGALREFHEGLNVPGGHQLDGVPAVGRSVDNATAEDVQSFVAGLSAPAP